MMDDDTVFHMISEHSAEGTSACGVMDMFLPSDWEVFA